MTASPMARARPRADPQWERRPQHAAHRRRSRPDQEPGDRSRAPAGGAGRAGGAREPDDPRRVKWPKRPEAHLPDQGMRVRQGDTLAQLGVVAPPAPVRTEPVVLLASGRSVRWPIGEPRTPEFRYCDAPGQPGRPTAPSTWRWYLRRTPAEATEAQVAAQQAFMAAQHADGADGPAPWWGCSDAGRAHDLLAAAQCDVAYALEGLSRTDRDGLLGVLGETGKRRKAAIRALFMLVQEVVRAHAQPRRRSGDGRPGLPFTAEMAGDGARCARPARVDVVAARIGIVALVVTKASG